MDPVSIAAILGAVAAALLALSVIFKYLKKAFDFFKKIETANNITMEFPEWQTKVNLAIKELHPNSGSSLKDQVTALTNQVSTLATQACETHDKVDTLGNNLDVIRDMLQSHIGDDQRHSQ